MEFVRNNLKNKGYDVVIEELKQNLRAVSQKIKRYTERVEQYNQNRMFTNNEKRYYQELQGTECTSKAVPVVALHKHRNPYSDIAHYHSNFFHF